jgi:2-dehydropantoate 2-reductase
VVRQSSAKAPSGSSNLPVAFVVFGPGAVGGFIAAALARAGHRVGVVARGAHFNAIRKRGAITVQASDLGAFDAPVEAFSDLREFDAPEFVLLTFKSHQWNGVLPQLEEAIAYGSTFVTLQNGLPFWYFGDRAVESVDPGGEILRTIPLEQIVGGVVHASGHVVAPGVIHQSGGMLYPLGELDGVTRPRTQRLAQAFADAGLNAPIEPVIRRNIWRKLVNNAAVNPVSALTRATVQRMLRDPGTRAVLHAMISQGLAVARATGVDPETDADERLAWAEHIADVKTSMLQDLEAGKPLELEPISGAVVELARGAGVPVPHIETVYALCKLLSGRAPER